MLVPIDSRHQRCTSHIGAFTGLNWTSPSQLTRSGRRAVPPTFFFPFDDVASGSETYGDLLIAYLDL